MQREQHDVDCVVIGAGVVGLSAARALALRGREVLILERNARFGEETSARNSEVIHAGLAYAPGSLKAAHCVDGKARLYAFCAERGVPHRMLGKIIVAAAPSGEVALARTLDLAAAAGVADLQPLDVADLRRLEPALTGVAGLLSPSTGIVDSHAFMLALLGEAEANGAVLSCRSAVDSGAVLADGRIALDCGELRLRVRHVVNCAGLWAQGVARRIDGLPRDAIPPQVLAKGSYMTLTGAAPFRHLIYPAPPGDGSLGVHLTLDMDGQARFGPDLEILDVEGPDAIDYSVDPKRIPVFEAAIRRYWSGLPAGCLSPGYAGCRPKLAAGDAAEVDFRLDGAARHGLPGHVMCYGLESPGLTAALSLGDAVADLALA